eukprot:5448-Heterococcus_DN1.PRE.2
MADARARVAATLESARSGSAHREAAARAVLAQARKDMQAAQQQSQQQSRAASAQLRSKAEAILHERSEEHAQQQQQQQQEQQQQQQCAKVAMSVTTIQQQHKYVKLCACRSCPNDAAAQSEAEVLPCVYSQRKL